MSYVSISSSIDNKPLGMAYDISEINKNAKFAQIFAHGKKFIELPYMLETINCGVRYFSSEKFRKNFVVPDPRVGIDAFKDLYEFCDSFDIDLRGELCVKFNNHLSTRATIAEMAKYVRIFDDPYIIGRVAIHIIKYYRGVKFLSNFDRRRINKEFMLGFLAAYEN